MRIIPYVRILLVACFVYRIIDGLPKYSQQDKIDVTNVGVRLFLDVALVAYLFYLLIEAFNEFNEKRDTRARSFRIYGLVIQAVLFVAGTAVMLTSKEQIIPWKLSISL